MKKPKATIEKPAPKAEAETPVAPVAAKTTAKKPSPEQKTPKKAPAVTPKPTAPPEITVSERVGLTAGSIWHYLAEHGATSVAKLLRELTEEEKISQRSIGWLAQEDKIALTVVDRVETIALKE